MRSDPTGSTRTELHRVAAHVLGRRRFAVSGHFGLRASRVGISTPAFGPEPEVVRLTLTSLVREVGSATSRTPLQGGTLAELAGFAGADLTAPFPAGAGTPDPGRRDEPLELDPAKLGDLYAWFELAWRVLDEVLDDPSAGAGWSTIQLWPEHFDAGTSLDQGSGAGVNLGFSPGDEFCEEPYAYVGPWGSRRPGGPDFWNAPFGAVLPRSDAAGAAELVSFLRLGLSFLEIIEPA